MRYTRLQEFYLLFSTPKIEYYTIYVYVYRFFRLNYIGTAAAVYSVVSVKLTFFGGLESF